MFKVVRFIGKDPAAVVRDWQGKKRTLRWGERCLVTDAEAKRLQRFGQFEVQEVDFDALLERADRDLAEEKVQVQAEFIEEPGTKATILVEISDLSLDYITRRMDLLVRLGLADFKVIAVAEEIPPAASEFWGTHNIGWFPLSAEDLMSLRLDVDYVMADTSERAQQLAAVFGAMPLALESDEWEVSDAILSAAEKADAAEGRFILVFGPLTQDERARLMIQFHDAVKVCASPPQKASERAELYKEAKVVVNLLRFRTPVLEREANLFARAVASINPSSFTTVLIEDRSALEAAISAALTTAVERVPWRPRKPLEVKSVPTPRPVREKVPLLLVHTFSTGRTGADITALELFHQFKEEFDIFFVGVKRAQSSYVPQDVDLLVENPADLPASLGHLQPRAVIADASVAVYLKEIFPRAKVAAYLHFLGDVAEDRTRPFETFHPSKLARLDVVVVPSPFLRDELKKLGINSILLEPFHDWARGVFEGKRKADLIFVPILYGHPDDVRFLRALVKALPDKQFVIGELRGDADFSDCQNVRIEWQEDLSELFRKTRVVLLFSRIPPTFSIIAWEAAAAGVPLIAEPVGGWKDLPRIALLDRDVQKWVDRITEIFKKRGPAFGGFCGQFTAAFQRRHFAGVDEWRELLQDLTSVGKVGYSIVRSGFHGVDRFLTEAERLLPGSGETEVPIYSVLSKVIGGVCFIASSLVQLDLDGQSDVLREVLNRWKDAKDRLYITLDERVARFLNRAAGTKICEVVAPPVSMPLVETLEPLEGSVAFVGTAPPQSQARKLPLLNLLAVALSGAKRVHISRSMAHVADAARLLGLEVTLEPFREQEKYWQWLSSMNAAVLLSAAEAFSYVAFEAWCLGVPCLVSDCVAASRYLPKPWEWLKLPLEADVDEVADALRRALRLDSEARRRLREAMAEVVEKLQRQFRRDFERLERLL